MKQRLFLGAIVPFAFLLVGCSADTGDSGDDAVGDEPIATSEEAVAAACHRNDTIYPQTGAADRWIIDRALTWVDDRVPYSQTHEHDGWRQDCSGFVSMSWELDNTKPGLTTETLDNRSHHIDWHDLKPGDALIVPGHHVFLFGAWSNKAHSEICAIEEYDYGHPASITLRSRDSSVAYGYQPIRRDN